MDILSDFRNYKYRNEGNCRNILWRIFEGKIVVFVKLHTLTI